MDKPYNSAINKKRTNPHKNVKKEPRSLHQYIINNVQFVLDVNNFYLLVNTLKYRSRRGRDRMAVGFTTTYAISAYHH
jgi:hypothetical protein